MAAPVAAFQGERGGGLWVTVLEEKSGAPLEGAWVRGRTSELRVGGDGAARLLNQEGDTLRVDYIGFQSQRVAIPSGADSVVVGLEACVVRLQEPN